jgi:hypothetical protein
VCKFDIKMTRVREAFQSLTIQPQINFPPPPLPPGLNPQQIEQFIQAWYANAAPPLLQQAVADAINRARKAAPTKGFQRVEHRRRWEVERAATTAAPSTTRASQPGTHVGRKRSARGKVKA